ncbi:MAG: ABC transporter substrate-binding protein [Chloroflexota bacterium]
MIMMMKRKIGFALLVLLLITGALLAPVQAQDASGRGVVVFAADSGGQTTLPHELYPNTCGSPLCAALQPLLYPRLFDVDPDTGALLDASRSDRALALSLPTDLPADQVEIPLRQDRTWSDGTPITAYDVLYSLLAFTEYQQLPSYPALRVIAGARVIDDHTIGLRYKSTAQEIASLPPNAEPNTGTCASLPRSNIYILPSHYLSPKFHDFVDTNAPEGDSPSLADWWKAYNKANLSDPFSVADQPVTSGAYRWAGFDFDQNARFVPSDGAGVALERAFNAASSSQRPAEIDAFIAGNLNLLLSVPFDQRAGLRSLGKADARNFQIAEVPGRSALVILLNMANPNRPLPGLHPETGQLLDQGKNPIFSGPAVRKALQLAIDPDEIVNGVFQQSAVRLSGLYPPSSWAYDPSLLPLETNLSEAKRLLEEAGWIDDDGDGGRTCVSCTTAPIGTNLSFSLGSPVRYGDAATQIAAEWQRIGVNASVYVGDSPSGSIDQGFDAYLQPIGGDPFEDADPDRSLMFTPAGDVLNPSWAADSLNYASYSNSEIAQLEQEALTLSGCDPAARAAIYHQVDRLLQADLPLLFVAAPDEFYAAAPNVLGFAPRTGDPLWNIESWVVSP